MFRMQTKERMNLGCVFFFLILGQMRTRKYQTSLCTCLYTESFHVLLHVFNGSEVSFYVVSLTRLLSSFGGILAHLYVFTYGSS